MKRLFSRYGMRWAIALVLVAIAFAQILGFVPTTLSDRLDVLAYDARMQLQSRQLDPRVVIVDIDEKSLAEVGRWPWSRDVVARLVDRLSTHYQVRAIGFDVVFAEPDTSSGYRTLQALAEGELKDDAAFAERVRALKPQLDYDRRLAAALQGRPVVLGYYLSNQPGAQRKGMLPAPAFDDKALGGRVLDALEYRAYSANLEELQRAASDGGYMNPTPDSDGVIRRLPLLAKVGDRYYESLALATARAAVGANRVEPVFFGAGDQLMSVSDPELREYGALKAVRLDAPHPLDIPVDRNLSVLIQYHGPGGPAGGHFRYVSATDVLHQRVPQEQLAGSIVLVGTTVAGLKDLRASPVNVDYPGVEMHANVIASILDRDFKHEPDFSAAFELLQVLAVGLVLGAVLPVLTPAFAILLAAATGIGVAALNFWMYQSLGWVMPVAAALLLVTALFVANIAWGYLFEYRKGRAMVNLFGEYVAPELVTEMAANPENYSMEGESRELTVLFCDVRGFTTISEGLDPNALREYINRYLTAMSEDIRGNRGTLDKYIGDAVMAFWGAPVVLPDHAARAVATALRMQATARALNREFVARGWPPLKIGIGLNTGIMRVGDMGSKIRRAYTVMGDAVNLSSRLEGITKVYGVGIAVGDATRLAAPQFAYRELDRVRVKGKNEPVPIFEPLGLLAELDDSTREQLEKWHAALELVRAQQWEQAQQRIAELRAIRPGDRLYDLYLERIAYFREHAPGPAWDGVTTFDTK